MINNNIKFDETQDSKKGRGYRVEASQTKDFAPQKYESIKTIYQGSTYAVVNAVQKPTKTHVKRIDSTHYRCLSTDEIKEYRTMTDKERNTARIATLKRTFADLRGLIRTNFSNEKETGCHSQKFITLTYKKNMQDPVQLGKDFEAFMKRLEYHYPHDYAYIAVMEPQGRGAWHVHLMLKALDCDKFYIDKDRLRDIWTKKKGHKFGNSYIEELKSDDVGAYYTAYFTGIFDNCHNDESDKEDVESDSDEVYQNEQHALEAIDAYCRMTGIDVNKEKKKAHLKGARLHWYPKHFKFFRCSQNVARPKVHKDMTLYDLEEEGYDKIYENAYSINKIYETGENKGEIEPLNKIYKATYKKVKPSKEALTDESLVLETLTNEKSQKNNPPSRPDTDATVSDQRADEQANAEMKQIHIDDLGGGNSE